MVLTRSMKKISKAQEAATLKIVNESKRGRLSNSKRKRSSAQPARRHGESRSPENKENTLAGTVETFGSGEIPASFAANAVMLCSGYGHSAFKLADLQELKPAEIISTSHENMYYTFLLMPTKANAKALLGKSFKSFRDQKLYKFMTVPKAKDLMEAFNARDRVRFREIMETINKFAEDSGVVPGKMNKLDGNPNEKGKPFLNESPVPKLAQVPLISRDLAAEIVREREKAPFVHWGEVCARVKGMTPKLAERLQKAGVKLTSQWWYINRKLMEIVTVASTAGYRVSMVPSGEALDPRFRMENRGHMIEQGLEQIDEEFDDDPQYESDSGEIYWE